MKEPTAEAPGPGFYEISKPSNGPAFTFGVKYPIPQPNAESPGPGAYNQLASFGKDAPAFTMSGKYVTEL